MRLVVGITGSTGVIYGVRLLEVLKKLGIETNLIMSEWAQKCITMETEHDLNYVKSLATEVSDDVNMAANISSGTHKTDGMIVIPCSMKTLSSVANGYDETLVARASGVILKESRKLTTSHYAKIAVKSNDKKHLSVYIACGIFILQLAWPRPA